jgi:hypothetical protein
MWTHAPLRGSLLASVGSDQKLGTNFSSLFFSIQRIFYLSFVLKCNVKYLPKAEIGNPEKPPLLDHGCVKRNNTRAIDKQRSHAILEQLLEAVLSTLSAPRLHQESIRSCESVSARVEANLNASNVALRVVEGNENRTQFQGL